MPYLLDTNHCSYIINGMRKSPDRQKPEETKTLKAFRSATEAVYTCDVVSGEIYYGAELKSNRDELYKLIDNFLLTAITLSADRECWLLFAQTKAGLHRGGKLIPDFDLLIACIASRFGCILVSNDSAFKNLPTSFQVETWAA